MSLLDPKQIRGGGSQTHLQTTVIAGETISGQSVVMIVGGLAFYYDPTSVSNAGKTLGMTNTGVAIGGSVDIILSGVISSGGWGLTPGSIYYTGVSGTITTTIHSPPFVQQRVGLAISSDTLNISFSEPIIII